MLCFLASFLPLLVFSSSLSFVHAFSSIFWETCFCPPSYLKTAQQFVNRPTFLNMAAYAKAVCSRLDFLLIPNAAVFLMHDQCYFPLIVFVGFNHGTVQSELEEISILCQWALGNRIPRFCLWWTLLSHGWINRG